MTEIERAAHALNHLNPECSRDEWVRIGMAAKSAGLSFEVFNNWSLSASNYENEKSCSTAWKSFNNSGAITSASLYRMAFAQGWEDPRKLQTKWTSTSSKAKNKNKKPINQTVSASVIEVWERCIPATNSEKYICCKQGNSEGLRVYPDNAPPLVIQRQNVKGYLVVPCLSNEQIQTLQFISSNKGDKLNFPNASFNDGFFTVGKITDRIYVCEGIGQAWAVNKSSGAAAVVCFGVCRMMTVAKVLREKYPRACLVIVPDRGKEKQAAEIATTVGGQWVEMPNEKPNNYDANDYIKELGSSELTALLESARDPVMHFKMLSAADLFNAATMRWVVRGVIPAEGLGALYGASGSGKSFLILDMGCAVAAGDDYWFGHRITQVPVTYVCLEGEAGMGKRVKAWSLYFKRPVPDALKFITQSFDLLSGDISELAKAVIAARGGAGLVIIDTLSRAAPGADENSSVDMGKIIAAAKKLQNLIGGLVLLVHHTGKDVTKGLRGHSSLYAALDSAIEVIKTDIRCEWNVAKCKDDVTGSTHPFKLELVQVGFNDEGNEITSCVTLFDDSNKAIQRKKNTLGSNQSIALNVLKDLLHNSPHMGKEGAPVESKCINYDEVLLLVAEQMPTDAKHRKSRASDAISGLVKREYLTMKGNWLWEK